MLKSFFLLSAIVLIFSSCNNNEQEIKELNSFLLLNFEFNNRNLNQNIAIYYQRIDDNPDLKIDSLNILEKEYDELIIKLEKARKSPKIEQLTNEYNSYLDKVAKTIQFDKGFYIDRTLTHLERKSNNIDFSLNIMKNNLAIVLSEAFHYAASKHSVLCGINTLNHVDTKVLYDSNKSVKIILSSNLGQIMKENRHVIIDKIVFNGSVKKVNYTILENYSFADINLDSLNEGEYTIDGLIRYYLREGKYEIPFKHNFEVK